jgi:putative mRNA 3-end processing factor
MHSAPLLRELGGYRISNSSIYIDPLEPVETAIVSHAHGDHAVPGHHTVYCSVNTARILRAKYRDFAIKVITPDWNEEFIVNGIKFCLVPAGHILGSAQIFWEVDNQKILYTGDFKRQADSTCEPFETKECDILITETTFANPEQRHPTDKDVLLKLKEKEGINFVIAAYALGKSQRMTKLLTDFLPERKIMLHHKVSRFHQVYKDAGYDVGIYVPYQRRVFKYSKDSIYIIPPSVLNAFPPSPNYLRGMVSGWDRLQQGMDLKIPISDHADWNDLLQTIKEVKPTYIYTIHGDGTILKKFLESDKITINEL